jgi:SAM-dependent methyltransferase
MLTVRYGWLGLRAGDRVLDLGCGGGRHAFEARRLGANVVAFDQSFAELENVAVMFGAMGATSRSGDDHRDGNGHARGRDRNRDLDRQPSGAACVNGDATRLPFPDACFDRVIAAEVLEHIPADRDAIAELARVLRPGGTMAVTVPAWLPERVCWALSDEYHAPHVDGGHVRIYSEPELRSKLRGAGLRPGAAHHAHSLHAPYWWLKCAVGPSNDGQPLVRAYHQVLVWDITGARPVSTLTRLADRVANPLMGKSLVVYARKP